MRIDPKLKFSSPRARFTADQLKETPKRIAVEAQRSPLDNSGASTPLQRTLGQVAGYIQNTAAKFNAGPLLKLLSGKSRREYVAQFVTATQLAHIPDIFAARADDAERAATLNRDPNAKIQWQKEALSQWLIAANAESPHALGKHTKSLPKAQGALRSLASLVGPEERALYEAAQALLADDINKAEAALQRAPSATNPALKEALEAGIRSIKQYSAIEKMLQDTTAPETFDDPKAAAQKVAAQARAMRMPELAMTLWSIGQEAAPESLESAKRALAKAYQQERAAQDPSRGDHLRAEHDLALTSLLASDPSKLGEALALAAKLAKSAPSKAQQFAAQLAVTELHRQGEDLDRSIEQGLAAWKTAEGPEQRGLAASYLAGLYLQRGAPNDLREADRIAARAIDELGHDKGNFFERAGRFLGRATHAVKKSLRGEKVSMADLLKRPPSNDGEAVLNELLHMRASISQAFGQGGRAKRLLSQTYNGLSAQSNKERAKIAQDYRKTLLEQGEDPSLVEQLKARPPELLPLQTHVRRSATRARALTLLPLSKISGLPVSHLLDEGLMGTPPNKLPPLTLAQAQLSLGTTSIAHHAQTAESLLSLAFRSRETGPLDFAIRSLTAAQQGPKGGSGTLARALGLSLVSQVLGAPPQAHDPDHQKFQSDNQTLEAALKTVARGLARPGENAELAQLLQRYDAQGAQLQSWRPTAEQTLNAATLLGRASYVLEPTELALLSEAKQNSIQALEQELRATAWPDKDSKAPLAQAQSTLHKMGFARQDGLWVRDDLAVRLDPMEVGESSGFMVNFGALSAQGELEATGRFVELAGLRFESKDWSLFEHGRERELRRYRASLRKKRPNARLPKDMKTLRTFISAGRVADSRRWKMGKLRELSALKKEACAVIKALQAADKMPKGIYIMVDGIDAASKTSNGESVAELFQQTVGYEYDTSSFKAPTEAEREDPSFLTRFDQRRPEHGQVFFADRSPLGNFAYDPSLDEASQREMGAEFTRWQRDMEDDGVMVIKMLFHPGSDDEEEPLPDGLSELWRPMFTFGKRQARAEAALDLLERMRAQGTPEDELPPGLIESAQMGPGRNDMKSFQEGTATHARFEEAAELCGGDSDNPWKIVKTETRHDGRVDVLRHLTERLIQHAEREGVPLS